MFHVCPPLRSVPKEASEQVDDLINACMVKNPAARPTAVDLVKVVSALAMPTHICEACS